MFSRTVRASRRIASLVLIVACVANSWLPAPHAQGAEQPDIVLIFTDDLGYSDVGCFGSQTNRTPRIDALAQQGPQRYSTMIVPNY